MPYIKQEQRDYLEKHKTPGNAGEFNYLVSNMCNDYIEMYGTSYSVINTLIGALECTKLELYSRVAIPYEAKKERINGDVYTLTGPSNENRAWAGGFFEGEGCFFASYYKPRQDGSKVFRTHASCVQKNEELLNQFKNVVGFGVVYPDGSDGMFCWKTTQKGEAKKLFELLRPYLGERRQRRFLELDEQEKSQIFNPLKPKREICSKNHILLEVGVRSDGTCAECDRVYKRNWYNKKKEELNINA